MGALVGYLLQPQPTRLGTKLPIPQITPSCVDTASTSPGCTDQKIQNSLPTSTLNTIPTQPPPFILIITPPPISIPLTQESSSTLKSTPTEPLIPPSTLKPEPEKQTQSAIAPSSSTEKQEKLPNTGGSALEETTIGTRPNAESSPNSETSSGTSPILPTNLTSPSTTSPERTITSSSQEKKEESSKAPVTIDNP